MEYWDGINPSLRELQYSITPFFFYRTLIFQP